MRCCFTPVTQIDVLFFRCARAGLVIDPCARARHPLAKAHPLLAVHGDRLGARSCVLGLLVRADRTGRERPRDDNCVLGPRQAVCASGIRAGRCKVLLCEVVADARETTALADGAAARASGLEGLVKAAEITTAERAGCRGVAQGEGDKDSGGNGSHDAFVVGGDGGGDGCAGCSGVMGVV